MLSAYTGVLVNSMKHKVKKAGNYVQCDSKVGRKTVLGTGFKVKDEVVKDNVVPLFECYGVACFLCYKLEFCHD